MYSLADQVGMIFCSRLAPFVHFWSPSSNAHTNTCLRRTSRSQGSLASPKRVSIRTLDHAHITSSLHDTSNHQNFGFRLRFDLLHAQKRLRKI